MNLSYAVDISGMLSGVFFKLFLHNSDLTLDFSSNESTIHAEFSEPWKVTLVDTGQDTMTGGRLLRVKDYLNGDNFFLTYGDGLSNVDLNSLKNFHNKHKKAATLTAVFPPGRFGALEITSNNAIKVFRKNLKVMAPRLMVVFLYLVIKFLIILKMIPLFLRSFLCSN